MSQSSLPVTPGSGASVAVDAISSVNYQQIKLTDGTIGSTTGIPGNGNGLNVQGPVADNAAAAGNPVRAGGKYNATVQTYADGDIADFQMDANGYLKIILAGALSKAIDSITSRPEGATYTNITASTLVRTGTGILVGMYVNSTSSGTIKFWDNTSAATTVINNTITPAIGYHNLGNAAFNNGLYATIANTLDVTIYYIPTP